MERYLNQFKGSLEKGVTTYYMNVSIGSTGAPTLNTTASGATENKGIQSIVRTGTGAYTITLGDPNHTTTVDLYQRILNFNYQFLSSSLSASPGLEIQLSADAVATAGTFGIQAFYNLSGTPTAVDIDSGFVLLMEIILKHGAI